MIIIYTAPDCPRCDQAHAKYGDTATYVNLSEIDTYGDLAYRLELRTALSMINWSGTAPVIVNWEDGKCQILNIL